MSSASSCRSAWRAPTSWRASFPAAISRRSCWRAGWRCRPKILIVDEPTRGIDIGSKVEVHNLLIEMAKSGIAVIVISSELPEILAVSDRIVTMREGRVTGEIARNNATQEILMSMMTAHESGGRRFGGGMNGEF